MGLPQYLYKYRSIDIYAEDMICHNSIFLSSPEHFNDPFDSSPDMVQFPNKEQAIQLLKDEKIKSGIYNETEFENYIKSDYDHYSHIISISNDLNKKLSKYGVCCFSETNTEILLWSHYANNHKGICIEFKPNYSKYPFNLLKNVIYSQVKPKVDFHNDEEIASIFETKYESWKYEQEFRIIDSNKTNIEIELDPSEITGVIVGFKTDAKDLERVKRWINRSKSKMTLYKSSKDFANYSLKIDRYITRELKSRQVWLKAIKTLADERGQGERKK